MKAFPLSASSKISWLDNIMDAFDIVKFLVGLELLCMNVSGCLNSKRQSTCASQIKELKRTVAVQQQMVQNMTEKLQNVTEELLDLNDELRANEQKQKNLTEEVHKLNKELNKSNAVRQEIKNSLTEGMQGLSEELKKNDAVQQQIKQNLTDELVNVTEELLDLNEELKKSDEAQQELKRNMTMDLQDLSEELNALKKDINLTVAFTAVLSQKRLTNLLPGETIIFDHIITNTDNVYDRESGNFTAPFDGLYAFCIDMMVQPLLFEYVQIVRNGQLVMWNCASAIEAKHYTATSRSGTIQLAAGDKVWIRADGGDGVIHGHSSFSGWLINSVH